KNEGGSVFSGTGFELLKKKYLGDHGHIAIGTNSVDRAYSYLRFNGYKFQENTAKKDQNGKLISIYFEEEFAGFAMHLVKKQMKG
ncbi:MAG: hypothetical protein GX352_04395, partial [Clostridiales bacterium]|nr:hypothetical protein [Clostridiales bacterium]